MLLELFLLCATLLACLVFLWKYNVSHWKKRNVPFIPAEFPFGNIKDIILMKRTIGEVYDDIYWNFQDQPFGGFYRFWKPAIMLRDPELIKLVFIKEFSSFQGNDYYVNPEVDPILGLNPFNCVGEKWTKARMMIKPSLTPLKIKGMISLIREVCSDLVVFLKDQEGQFVEGYDVMGRFTTDVIASCAFGLKSNSFTDPNSKLRELSSKMFETGIKGNIALICALYAPKVGNILKFKIFSEEVNKYFIEIVKAACEYRVENNMSRNDYLQSLINTNLEYIAEGKGNAYTHQEMAAHCMTFFLDGFESASIVLSFILYELSLNNDIENKLRNEIKEVGLKVEDFDFEQIQGIEYLDMVVMETLRKHPPGTTMARLCNKTTLLKSGDTEILVEKGMSVALPMYSIHNDPKYFPKPETFDPTRFTEENKALRPEFSFFPFGGGPRSCLGFKFALTMIKLVIVDILLNFSLEPKNRENVKLELNPMNTFFHSAKDGLWVKYNTIIK